MNARTNNLFSIAVLVAIVGAAALFAGPMAMINSAFANEDQPTAVPSKEGSASKEGTSTSTATTETTQPAVEEPTQSPADTSGNAFFTVEQATYGLSPECLIELDGLDVNVFANGIVINNPEVQQAIETGAAEIASELPENTVQPEVNSGIQEVIVELESNNTQVADAAQATVNETTVAETAAENAIVEEIIELEGVQPAANEAVLGGVESVLNNTATAEEANATVVNDLAVIAENVDVTVEDVQTAVENVQSDNAVVADLGGNESAANDTVPSKEEGNTTAPAATEPSKEEGNTTAPETGTNATEVSPEVTAVVTETMSDNAEEIAQDAGTDANTVRALIDQAQAALSAAEAQLG